MLIEELIGTRATVTDRQLRTIHEQCSTFLTECGTLPLYKLLPRSYADLQRVKVRLGKRRDGVSEAFNKAFTDYTNIRQRAVFAAGTPLKETKDFEPFYVFPIDGFRFAYSKEVQNSSTDYQHMFESLMAKFDDTQTAVEIVSDLVSYTYSRSRLVEGITSKCEIILYNIPYYYAVRANTHNQYAKLIGEIRE